MLRFLVLLSLTMATAMTLGDFIKSGGWDKVKFRDASGFANFDFKYTTRKQLPREGWPDTWTSTRLHLEVMATQVTSCPGGVTVGCRV